MISARRVARRRCRETRPGIHRYAITLALLCFVPAIGVFCWHWASQALPQGSLQNPAVDPPGLEPIADHQSRLPWPGRTGASAPIRGYASAGWNDPFEIAYGPRLMAASVDPFYEALAAGAGEGRLVRMDGGKGIPTFATPLALRRAANLSDGAILREIQHGVGGSLSNFVKNVFGASDSRESAQGADPSEENPFVKPAGSDEATQGAGDRSIPKVEPESKSQSESEPASAPPAETPSPDPAPPVSVSPVTTIRPDIMLHVAEDGTLHAIPAARLNERTYESAEMGIRQFDAVSFANPADNGAAIAVADYNQDGASDLCLFDPRAGMLRLLYGSPEGFSEAMRIDVGLGKRSLAAGDFDFDGKTDIAVSDVGVGTLTYISFGESDDYLAYRSLWIDRYRDYIAAFDTAGRGLVDLLGMNFANVAEVLDLGQARGAFAGGRIEYAPALDFQISTFHERKVQLNAVLLGSGLSVNLQNYQNQLSNVVNVQEGSDIYVIIGDLRHDNTISVALATLRK